MSAHISTLDDKVFLRSFADKQGFGLVAMHSQEGEIGDASHPWNEYSKMVSGYWADFIDSGRRPKIMGHEVSNNGLVALTLHYLNAKRIGQDVGPQRFLACYLTGKSRTIGERLNEKEYGALIMGLGDFMAGPGRAA